MTAVGGPIARLRVLVLDQFRFVVRGDRDPSDRLQVTMKRPSFLTNGGGAGILNPGSVARRQFRNSKVGRWTLRSTQQQNRLLLRSARKAGRWSATKSGFYRGRVLKLQAIWPFIRSGRLLSPRISTSGWSEVWVAGQVKCVPGHRGLFVKSSLVLLTMVAGSEAD